MSKNNLSALSNEALIKRKNLLKGATIGLGIVWLAALIVVISFFFYFKPHAEKSFGLFIPLVVVPLTLLPSFIQLRLVNAELKLREQP